MAGNNQSNKDKGMASYLKDHGVRRTSGACPWGCGKQLSNGGNSLVTHLGHCQGKRSKAKD